MDTTEYELTDDSCYPIGPPLTYNRETGQIEIHPSRIRGRINTGTTSTWEDRQGTLNREHPVNLERTFLKTVVFELTI